MARILVLFASFDAQTARIAARIGATLAKDGHGVEVLAFDAPDAQEALGRCDALVVGGAIRYGRFAKGLERLVREQAARIASLPNTFFSVCLSARRPVDGGVLAARYLEEFSARTGWAPRRTASFAGALLYRKYNPLLRLVMRFISALAGGDTDTSRDYEYTDWAQVERFAGDFCTSLRCAGAG